MLQISGCKTVSTSTGFLRTLQKSFRENAAKVHAPIVREMCIRSGIPKASTVDHVRVVAFRDRDGTKRPHDHHDERGVYRVHPNFGLLVPIRRVDFYVEKSSKPSRISHFGCYVLLSAAVGLVVSCRSVSQ
jgi:hypothetical protein